MSLPVWTDGAPWPVVGECFCPRGHMCPQCDGSHEHRWLAWHDAPAQVCGGPGVPVRCKECGARKCDSADCLLRRHHKGPHEQF